MDGRNNIFRDSMALDDQEKERGQRERDKLAKGEKEVEKMGRADSSSQISPK